MTIRKGFLIGLGLFSLGALISAGISYAILYHKSQVVFSPKVFSQENSAPTKKALLPDSTEHAKEILIGTWTFTNPMPADSLFSSNVDFFGGSDWKKIVFRPDGTCRFFEALPADSNWGKGESCRWAVKTSKYHDTGERFWYADIDGDSRGGSLILLDGHHAKSAPNLSDFSISFVKADVFPFSK